MSEIRLCSSGKEPIKDLVTQALAAEERELLTALLKTKEHLLKFEEKHHLPTSEFISLALEGIEDLEAIEWQGEYETLKRIEEKLKILKEIEVCT